MKQKPTRKKIAIIVPLFLLDISDVYATGSIKALLPIGGIAARADGVNADGSVVVGQMFTGAFENRAFRWTLPVGNDDGMVNLGALNGGNFSIATSTNPDDGTVVVGQAIDGDAGNQSRAFRWTQPGWVMTGAWKA